MQTFSNPENPKEPANAIQNHAVHSTQDIDEKKERGNKDSLTKLEKQLAKLKRQTRVSSKLLRTYKKNKEVDPAKVAAALGKLGHNSGSKKSLLTTKTLSDYLTNRKILHKEVFKIINKRDFKKMMPKSLKVIMH